MAASYVASMTPLTGLTATSGTWTLPVGWQPGDVAFFWYYHRSNINTFTEPAGVTQKHDHTTGTSSDGRLFLGYRTLESGDSTFVWAATNTDPSIPQVWGCDVFRGVDAIGDPFQAESGSPTLITNTVSPNPPAVTPSTDDALVITLFSKNQNITVTPPTAPTNYTLASYGTTVNNATVGVAYRLLSGGGGASEDPGAWTLSSQVGSNNFAWTAAFGEGVVTKIGCAVFGKDGTVKAPLAALFSLDGNTNVLSDSGKLKVAGTAEVTGVLTLGSTINFPDGVRQTFNPNGTNAGLNVGSQAGDPSAPSNGDLWYDSTANELTARINGANVALGGGGGSGDSTTTDAEASKPAAGNDGNLFFPNNGFYVWRDNGTIWEPWGPLFPMTPPVDGDFSWVNQGGASVVTTNGGIHLTAPAGAGNNLRIRVKTAPSTPYVITAALIALRPNVNFASVGLCFRESGTGEIAVLDYAHNAQSLIASAKFTSPTVFSATYTSVNWPAPSLVFLRIADNGTDRICSVSHDGQHWMVIHSVGRTDFLTADQVGFFAHSNNATWPAAMTLLSWKQT